MDISPFQELFPLQEVQSVSPNDATEQEHPKTQQKIMTIAEAFIADGRKEGAASLLTLQLKHRFPTEVTDRHLFLINETDQDTLSHWGKKLMDVKNINDIFVDFLS